MIDISGKAQGVAIVWKTACFFETPFVCETNANIARHFFTPDDRVVAPSDWPSQVSANPASNVPKRRATDFLRQLLLPDFPDMSLVAVASKRRNDRLSAFMQAVRSASFAALPGQVG